jgi:large subunit ribosomal protein L5
MNMQEMYKKKTVQEMKKKYGYKNDLAVPQIKKVVVNIGVGRMMSQSKDSKTLDAIEHDLAMICGQKPVRAKAKKSIAGFKLREGTVAGLKCTLRGEKMYSFLERLVNIAFPRTRDFRGISKESIDKGVLTVAIKEHIVFPEVVAEKVSQIFGFEVSIVTNAQKPEETESLLRFLGFPIKK